MIKGYTLLQAFAFFDADKSHYITCSELEEGLRAMKVEVSSKDLANIFNILDVDKDNKVSLDEFERRIEKYMGQRGGIVKDFAEDSVIPKEMQEELKRDLQKEVVTEIAYDDFGVKTLTAEERAQKEQAVKEALEKGEA